MKYKELIIGAALSLAVTLIGITTTFYINKTTSSSNHDKLSFAINQSTAFSSDSQDLAITSITLKNEGDQPAKQTLVSVALDHAEIRDVAIKTNNSIKYSNKTLQKNSLELMYDSLLPSDSITIELLLSSPEKPKVNLRSSTAIGAEATEPKELKAPTLLDNLKKWVIPAIIITLTVYYLAVIFSRKAERNLFPKNKNNSAFILLHNGFTTEAGKILFNAISDGDYSPYAFSNYALCKSIANQNEQAQALLNCAKYFTEASHANAVYNFNKAIILYRTKEPDLALEAIKEAIKLSPKQIQKYYISSIHTKPMKADSKFSDLFTSKQNK